MDWVCEEGFCDEATRDKDWIEYPMMLLDGREPIAEYERVKRCLTDFFATKTKAELLDAAMARRLLITPVCTTADVAASKQLDVRGYWEDVDHGELGLVRYPGAFARFSASPLEALPAAPELGVHTEEVLGEADRSPHVVVSPPAPSTTRPLAGCQGARLHVGHGRACRGPGPRRLRGRDHPGRVGQQDRRGPHPGSPSGTTFPTPRTPGCGTT